MRCNFYEGLSVWNFIKQNRFTKSKISGLCRKMLRLCEMHLQNVTDVMKKRLEKVKCEKYHTDT